MNGRHNSRATPIPSCAAAPPTRWASWAPRSGAITDMKKAYAKERDVKVREAILFGLAEISRDNVSINVDRGLEKLFIGGITDADAQNSPQCRLWAGVSGEQIREYA